MPDEKLIKNMENLFNVLNELDVNLTDLKTCIVDARNTLLEQYDKAQSEQKDKKEEEFQDKEVIFKPDFKPPEKNFADWYTEQEENAAKKESIAKPPEEQEVQEYFVEGWLTGKAGKILLEVMRENEPFVIFRAKDLFTPFVLNTYIELIEKFAPEDYSFLSSLVEVRKEIKAWQRKNRYSVRFPD